MVFFSETPRLTTMAGAAIIILSGIVIATRDRAVPVVQANVAY